MKEWTYNRDTDAWNFGSSNDGGAVFLDRPLSKKNSGSLQDQVWTGNAVYGDSVNNIGDCTSKEEAIAKVEAEYDRMRLS